MTQSHYLAGGQTGGHHARGNSFMKRAEMSTYGVSILDGLHHPKQVKSSDITLKPLQGRRTSLPAPSNFNVVTGGKNRN